jgi:hypothetical protein
MEKYQKNKETIKLICSLNKENENIRFQNQAASP